MSIIVLQKTLSCDESVSTVINITESTLFTLETKSAVNATIFLNNSLVATLTSRNPTFIANTLEDYTINIVGQCRSASVHMSTVIDQIPVTTSVDVESDCQGNVVNVPVNSRVSIVGSERPINVRVIESCTPALDDYEIVCASTDGRLLMLNTTSSPPVLAELDGTAVVDGATAINCDVEYTTIDKCFQDNVDSAITYTRIITYPIGNPTDVSLIWIDSTGQVIVEPVDITPCESSSGTPVVTTVDVVPNDYLTTLAGNTADSLYQLSVSNTGNNDGVFNGSSLKIGMTRTYTGYYDNSTNEFKRINTMAYDASGTEFDISETP